MTRVLILYYSSYGHIRTLAQAEAEGARSVPGVQVDLRRVPETLPPAVREAAGYVTDGTREAAVEDLPRYDAIILGTPTRFGNMAAQMKQFIDQAGGAAIVLGSVWLGQWAARRGPLPVNAMSSPKPQRSSAS